MKPAPPRYAESFHRIHNNEMTTDELIGSVTHLLQQLRDGEASAAQQALWERYFRRLAGIARTKLTPAARRSADEEDIALSALNSFFQAAEQGRYPDLRDRTGLWPLLACIATRRALKRNEHEFTAKRGGGQVRGDSGLAVGGEQAGHNGFDHFIGTEPTPDSIVELQELTQRLMGQLENTRLREVAQLKLIGHSNREIASQLAVTERTVERKLARIRHLWLILDEADG